MRMHKSVEHISQVPLRRSTRERIPAIGGDFQVYLSEDAYDIRDIIDPKTTFLNSDLSETIYMQQLNVFVLMVMRTWYVN